VLRRCGYNDYIFHPPAFLPFLVAQGLHAAADKGEGTMTADSNDSDSTRYC
jgi:hypothetical protein